ncbi:MAG TPA: FAD-dependent oxidoreductase, partial [Mycobacteriales bacterium]|nr:FAD-dependent oxidoreductase [Mycobacteriales bacterium]
MTHSPAASDQPYDVVILGGGSGGYSCALRAAQLGQKVLLIEKGKLGGTCLHQGCIPTKALLHAAEVADATRESEQFGVKAEFGGIDMTAVNAYKEGVTSRLYSGLKGLLGGDGITTVEGEGRLVSPNTVQVGDRQYTGRNIVLATGSAPRSLPGLDIDHQKVINSDDALQLD